MARELNAIVSETILVNAETLIVRVVPDGWELAEHHPGQYCVIGLPGSAPRCDLSEPDEQEVDPDKMIIRAYSIASASNQQKHMEFYVTLVRSGALTPRLFSLKRGDRVHLGQKVTGVFTLKEIPEESNLVLMATGTGLAPYMSMIRTFLTPESKRRFCVIHGARHSWDLGYSAQLSLLNGMLPHFDYIPVVSRPQDEITPWGGESGYIQDIWKRGLVAERWGEKPAADTTHAFLCGNPSMVVETLALLEADGFSEHTRKVPGEVHLERYW